MSDHAYPPAPWRMHGSMWLSVFRLGEAADERHPAGIYGAALVDYQEPSPLTYGELLVARSMTDAEGERAVTITDIWVDSPASRAGGRELWAIPKGLCSFERATARERGIDRTRWEASVDGRPVAAADFTDISRLAPRVPFRGRVEQPGIPDHPDTAHVVMSGNARALPCRGRWRLAADGPLAFLRGARQLGTFRMVDFRLHFD